MTSVSFVVPVYNKSLYLKHVVSSLKQQKGKFEKEFIFIDDGSSDDSYKKLLSLTKSLNNSLVIRQKNRGSANATNVGIGLAKMKYIKFLDADDVILTNATNCLLKLLEQDNDLILAYGLQRKVAKLDSVDLKESFNSQNYVNLVNKYKLDICLDISHLVLSANYRKVCWKKWFNLLKKRTKHIHLSDAKGVFHEGLGLKEGEFTFYPEVLNLNCMKVIPKKIIIQEMIVMTMMPTTNAIATKN